MVREEDGVDPPSQDADERFERHVLGDGSRRGEGWPAAERFFLHTNEYNIISFHYPNKCR